MATEYVDLVDEQLRNSKTIAVVGLSNNPDRDSHRVASYLQSQGYRIIPVNPVIEEALGEKSYPDLKSVPESIDMVDVFRRSDQVPPVVDEAIEVGARYIWMQDGVINEEAKGQGRGRRHPGSHERLRSPPAPPPLRPRVNLPSTACKNRWAG
ncbi:Uncharacterized protein YneT [Geodia barretti]|uniref:Uncharacterized protein YneT n=1 Tax=Geodia barretti TaxID=519541 RepID=A0AA35WUB4_GEOBA|nr:Uncharacterized protein YneT [Geodia barretti]